jgi:hypothetical protein
MIRPWLREASMTAGAGQGAHVADTSWGRGMHVEERVSCAEAWALALAERLNIPLVPTDHHAFDAIERQGHF